MSLPSFVNKKLKAFFRHATLRDLGIILDSADLGVLFTILGDVRSMGGRRDFRLFSEFLEDLYSLSWEGVFGKHNDNSEYNIYLKSDWHQLIRFLLEVSIQRIPLHRPNPGFFFQPKSSLYKNIAPQNTYSVHPSSTAIQDGKESWYYVNGIATTKKMAKRQCQYLCDIFKRKIIGLYNPSAGILSDLVECGMGRTWNWGTEPVEVMYQLIKRDLEDEHVDRVVLIGHSQGTIISSNIVNKLVSLHPELPLEKLEVYLFATCADEIKLNDKGFPTHIEHFINEHDVVARLSIKYNKKRKRINNRFDLPGKIYLRRNWWGHLLNTDYLPGFEGNKYLCDDCNTSRLHQYLDGNCPEEGSYEAISR